MTADGGRWSTTRIGTLGSFLTCDSFSSQGLIMVLLNFQSPLILDLPLLIATTPLRLYNLRMLLYELQTLFLGGFPFLGTKISLSL